MLQTFIPKKISIYSLLISNILPLVGVFFFHWDIFSLLFLYWFETTIIGILNVIKIIYSTRYHKMIRGYFLVPFFCFHFGGFLFGHLFLLLFFFSPMGLFGDNTINFYQTPQIISSVSFQVLFSILALAFSHILSFIKNYLGEKEYIFFPPDKQMGRPYQRVIIMHLTILFGGIYLMSYGSSFFGIILLIVLKTFFDLRSHLKSHAFKKL